MGFQIALQYHVKHVYVYIHLCVCIHTHTHNIVWFGFDFFERELTVSSKQASKARVSLYLAKR